MLWVWWDILWVFLTIYFSFQRGKIFENRLGFDKVMAISWWSTFLGHSVFANVDVQSIGYARVPEFCVC